MCLFFNVVGLSIATGALAADDLSVVAAGTWQQLLGFSEKAIGRGRFDSVGSTKIIYKLFFTKFQSNYRSKYVCFFFRITEFV